MKKIIFTALSLFAMANNNARAQQSAYKDPVSFKFKNGLTLIVAENHSVPKVYSSFSFDEDGEKDIQKIGLMQLISRLYNLSSGKEEFKNTFLSMFGTLKKPEITSYDFDRIKKQLSSDLHTKDHPYGELVTESVLQALTLEDLLAFYKTHVNAAGAYITIAGDITPAAARALVEKAVSETDLTSVLVEEDENLNQLI